MLIATFAWVLAAPLPAVAVPKVDVGTHYLQPDTPGQVVEIYVTGGDLVQGINFYVMVANGGPEMEEYGEIEPGTGILGPAITDLDILTDTIFDGNNTGRWNTPDPTLRQVAIDGTTTLSGHVVAEGLLARVTLDTTGFHEGNFSFSLSAFGEQTDFAGVPIDITDGWLIIESGQTPPPNWRPPTANAGRDRQVAGGSVVELAGSGSSPDGLPLTYKWRQVDGPPVVLTGSSSPTATFTAPNGVVNTVLRFELTVSDGTNSATDTVAITVNANQTTFKVNAGPDQSVAPGAVVQLNATVESPTPLTLHYEWIQIGGPTVIISGASTANASFQAPVGVTNTTLAFEVHAFDGRYEAVDTVSIHVDASDAKPTAHAGEDQAVAAGAHVQLTGSAIDPTGLGVSYLWVQISGPPVVLSSHTVANPTFTAPTRAVATRLEFELRVTAGQFTSIDTVMIHVAAASRPNPPPPEDPDDKPITPSPVQPEQSTWQFPNWTTSTAIAVGAGLLILALLLLWILL